MIIVTKNIKKVVYLFAFLGLCISSACSNQNSERNKEVMICPNIGKPCIDDHSCCIIKEPIEDSTNIDEIDDSEVKSDY